MEHVRHDRVPQALDPTDAKDELFRAWDRLTEEERETIVPTLIHDTSWGAKLSPLVPWRPQRMQSI